MLQARAKKETKTVAALEKSSAPKLIIIELDTGVGEAGGTAWRSLL
jgi:hypothetical protein